MEQESIDRILVGNSNIRKLTIGDPINGLSYAVGNRYGKGKGLEVTQIILDENAYYLWGALRYLIYVKKVNTDDQSYVWKLYERQPVCVEFDVVTN